MLSDMDGTFQKTVFIIIIMKIMYNHWEKIQETTKKKKIICDSPTGEPLLTFLHTIYSYRLSITLFIIFLLPSPHKFQSCNWNFDKC